MSMRQDFQTCYNAIRFAAFKSDQYDAHIPRHLQGSTVHNAALLAFLNNSNDRERCLRLAWHLMTNGKHRHEPKRMASYRFSYDTIRAGAPMLSMPLPEIIGTCSEGIHHVRVNAGDSLYPKNIQQWFDATGVTVTVPSDQCEYCRSWASQQRWQ